MAKAEKITDTVVYVYLPKSLARKLERIARSEGRTMSAWLRRCVECAADPKHRESGSGSGSSGGNEPEAA